MMGCWIVAGYMAYSGIDYTYNTIFYTEWMNLTSKGGEEIWTFRTLFSYWSDGDIHCCLFWHMGIRFVLAYGNPFCEAFVLGKLFLEQLVLWNGFRRKPYVDGMRSIGYASAWSE